MLPKYRMNFLKEKTRDRANELKEMIIASLDQDLEQSDILSLVKERIEAETLLNTIEYVQTEYKDLDEKSIKGILTLDLDDHVKALVYNKPVIEKQVTMIEASIKALRILLSLDREKVNLL